MNRELSTLIIFADFPSLFIFFPFFQIFNSAKIEKEILVRCFYDEIALPADASLHNWTWQCGFKWESPLLCTGSLLWANPALSPGCALLGAGAPCKSSLPKWPLPPVGLIFSKFPLYACHFPVCAVCKRRSPVLTREWLWALTWDRNSAALLKIALVRVKICPINNVAAWKERRLWALVQPICR